MLILALLRGIQKSKEEQIVQNCLQGIKNLIEIDELYGLTDYLKKDDDQYLQSKDSVLEQLRINEALKTLHNC